MKEPSYKIAWKFNEAKKKGARADFKQFCIRHWAMERKIDLSSYNDSDITNNDLLKIGRKAVDDNKLQNDKDEFEVDNIQRRIENRLNIIIYGCTRPQNNRRISVGKNTELNVKSMVFFDELLKIDARTLERLIRLSEIGLKRVAWDPNDRHLELDEEGFWGTVGEPNPKADYYETLIVQGLRALEDVKRINLDKKKIEKRIALLYPWADEEERIYESSEGIWRLDNMEQTLAKFEEEYPRDDLQNKEVYKCIRISMRTLEDMAMQSHGLTL